MHSEAEQQPPNSTVISHLNNAMDSNMEIKCPPMCNSGNRQAVYTAMDINTRPCNKLIMNLVVNKGQFDVYIQVLVNTSQGSK